MTTDSNLNAWVDAYPDETIPWQAMADKLGWQEPITFASLLQAHRLSEGWTQIQTAKQLGMSKQLYGDYEKGRKLPSLQQALRLCSQLGLAAPLAVSCLLDEQLRQAGMTDYTVKLEKAN